MDDSSAFLFDSVGLVGVAFYIGAYAALQIGLLRGSGTPYTILNMIAAMLVLVSLTNNFNLSSAVIQITWIAISVFGLTRHFILHHSTRLSAEESAFIRSKLPQISRPLARKLFKAGAWSDLDQGTVIATQDRELGALVYLLLGEAEVTHNGQPVGHIQSDTFIGELTCLDGGVATASVTVKSPSRVFRISSKALQKLCSLNPDLHVAFEKSIRKDTGLKLVAANALLSQARVSKGA